MSDPHDAGETTVGNVTGHNSELRTAPAVIAIASTRDGDHVIVVTGEDKSIRVFEQYERGQLRCISQRYDVNSDRDYQKLTGVVSCPNGHVLSP